MDLTFTEQIRIILRRRGLSVRDLAGMIGTSYQNLNQQFLRDNFREKDMQKMAAALGCDFRIEISEK